jgi:cellulose synthase/poly-beta-1,6-N-acetylglucosamine synthase-like glycosyltransferase
MDWFIIVYTIMFFFGIYFLILFLMLYFKNRKNLCDYSEPQKFFPITIVIPVFNEGKAIFDTLQSVVDLEYPKGKKKIVVVDDCSTDNSYKIIKEFAEQHKNMIVVQTPKNTGNAAGSKNYGMNFVKTPLVAFVDSDSLPSPDSLIKMVGYFEEDEKVAAVTSRVLVKNDSGNFMKRFQALDYLIIAWGRKILDFIGCVYVTNGPLSIYRTEAMEKEGGFDDKNLTEDIEITWKFLSRGYKTKMSYATKVYTIVPDNFKVWNKQRIRWNLGGLQTVFKYRKYFFKNTDNLFGYLVINYVSASFLFALIGFFLLIRQFYFSLVPIISSIPYYFKGYNPFMFIELNFNTSLLFFLGALFMILALFYYKTIAKELPSKRKSIRILLIYIFVYMSLYIIPLLLSLVKLVKRDMRWYTK